MEALLNNIDVAGGVLALVVGTWMILTPTSGIMRQQTDFMMVAVQMFGFLFLVRDPALDVAGRNTQCADSAYHLRAG